MPMIWLDMGKAPQRKLLYRYPPDRGTADYMCRRSAGQETAGKAARSSDGQHPEDRRKRNAANRAIRRVRTPPRENWGQELAPEVDGREGGPARLALRRPPAQRRLDQEPSVRGSGATRWIAGLPRKSRQSSSLWLRRVPRLTSGRRPRQRVRRVALHRQDLAHRADRSSRFTDYFRRRAAERRLHDVHRR